MTGSARLFRRAVVICAFAPWAALGAAGGDAPQKVVATAAGVEVTAFTVPSKQLEIASEIGGVVARVLVEEGDTVKKGQLLVELNAEIQKAELAISRARLDSAQLQIEAAEATARTRKMEAERMAALLERKVAAAEESDRARLEMELARLAHANAVAQRKMLELVVLRDEAALNQTVIRAPADGRVFRIARREGEAVQQQSAVASIVSIDPLYVITNAPLAAAERILPGAKAQLTLENLPGKSFECVVLVADRVADPASGTCRIKLSLPNPAGKMVAGAKGTVKFAAGE